MPSAVGVVMPTSRSASFPLQIAPMALRILPSSILTARLSLTYVQPSYLLGADIESFTAV